MNNQKMKKSLPSDFFRKVFKIDKSDERETEDEKVKKEIIGPTIENEIKLKNELLPKFEKTIPNYVDDENAKKIRRIINDEFNGGKNGWDLQCTEYVQFKIKEMLGINIKWSVKHNRNGGNWAIIFEKHGPYKVLDTPKQHCAISFPPTANNPFGHIAFVEKVNEENGLINISEANWPDKGKYNERPLKREEWYDKYRARFIDFSDDSVVTGVESIGVVFGANCEIIDNTIFLSHSGKDKDLAKEIKSALNDNFDVFIAYEDLKLSDRWKERIKNEISCRKFFIALITKNYFDSIISMQESGIAIGLDKNIIPVFIDVEPKDTSLLYDSHGFVFDAQKTMEYNYTELSKKLLLID